MREFEFEEKLKKTLSKLEKKDKVKYSIVINKIDEILSCIDVEHYKNLRAPKQEFKRVHIGSNFVLLFKYDKQKDFILFFCLNHHDEVYRL
ncbi:MAG: addiction module toxin RelE [Nanoarchaeota archaeon]